MNNRAVNNLVAESLKDRTLIGTWVDMDDIPTALSEGKDIVFVAPNRMNLVARVEDLTSMMRKARLPYKHIPWVKGQSSVALAFKIVCLDSSSTCYCLSEENINIIKQVRADQHCRIL